jgi:catechol 2,3-dioxygenase-like lactoylglutathione lyase family enzyme
MIQRLSHFGLCVADLERSLRFYCEGLGFQQAGALDVAGEPSATLLELPGVALRARWLERDGFRLELLHYPAPGATGDGRARAMNERGYTHLSFRVADLDAATAHLEALGGRRLAHTRIDNPQLGMRALFVLDPDGARLELIEGPGDPAALPVPSRGQ